MSADEKLDWLCQTVLRIDLAGASLQSDVAELNEKVDALDQKVSEIRKILTVDEEAANLKAVRSRQ